MPSDTTCRACHAKPPKQTSRSDSAKYNHSQEISAEHFWLMCLLYCVCHAECIFAEPIRDSSKVPRRQRFWSCYKTLTFCSLLARCRIPCACHEKRFNVQNWSVHVVLLLFWLRHDSTIFDMCFAPQRRARFQHPNFQTSSDTEAHFDFEICFVPQWRALFQQLNFQKLRPSVFCTFSLRHVFRHKGVHFSTSQFPKVLRTRQFFATTACNFSSLIWPDGSAPATLASLLFHKT